MSQRYLGIDLGAESVKVVELVGDPGALRLGRRARAEHHKDPGETLLGLLRPLDWGTVGAAAVTGRLGRQVVLARVPAKQALAGGFSFLYGDQPATVVSIGSHGFSVLELRDSGALVFRENSRCSQGTGNFLRQLVERFDLTIEEASALCADVDEPAPLSGRCPVILKTDMTHLANKGEDRARILAGLYDAVCENVQVLIKPRVSPPRVLLTGGVVRARRIRENFRRYIERHAMTLIPEAGDEQGYLEAIGAALAAAEQPAALPSIDELLRADASDDLERVPALADSLARVRRMERVAARLPDAPDEPLIVGYDIGSTGSKAVAISARTSQVAWEGYISTSGDPVRAAQELTRQLSESPASRHPIAAFGATGSGREIVGSLLSTCYGVEHVYVLNEIAAHAEGALHFDPRVDTIFEIGGQDAKYIRLSDGRVVDAAMNEACSAGTGSFIEEQGRRFSGIRDVVHLGEEALGAGCGVSLGQHCSVFMAEIIDEAVAVGVERRAIIAGIYDSIIGNYLNRVKGSRSVGDVIFCQGMPFSADALAAAVVRQTGSEVVIPPNPGTVGALGIALLTRKAVADADGADTGLDPGRFLAAELIKKDSFTCKSTRGCGGAGNHCRIDRLVTEVEDKRQRFTWGGGCSLWDKGTGKVKLPDRAPDPFRERERLVAEATAPFLEARGGSRVALTDEFLLKELFPFFASFLFDLGFDLVLSTGADQSALKRGIEEANVPFCAPMQQYHGLVSAMADQQPDFLFMPMIRSTRRKTSEPSSVLCPVVQASPDMLALDLAGDAGSAQVLSPVIDLGLGDIESPELLESCLGLARQLGVQDERAAKAAYERARDLQAELDAAFLELGRHALAFCADSGVVPVVVLGRPYTIYNSVLNSNVPAILREQGAMAVPIDCYPIDDCTPVFDDMFWGHGQRNLRAASQIRRTEGTYSIWCSNYSCGPDSFNLHFYGYLMEGKPFAVIETDGHSGDAGTKTRVEAFLHCVRADLEAKSPDGASSVAQRVIARDGALLNDIRERGETVLIPRMGPGAESLAACLRGIGVPAEALPTPDRESVRIGRRFTSGKECVPMCITTGSLLQRLDAAEGTDRRFAFFMPTADGPCRFGVYNLLHNIVLDRQGLKDRVRIWSPGSGDYFGDVPPGFAALAFTGFAAADMLLGGLLDARPVETSPGAADAIHARYEAELYEKLEEAGRGDLSFTAAMLQVATGRLFGATDVLRRAAAELAAIKGEEETPTVLMVGEIYVRCDPFANDFAVRKLEERGISVRLAPFTEWLEYTDQLGHRRGFKTGFGAQLSSFVQRRIQARTYRLMGDALGWPERTTVGDTLHAAEGYVRDDLYGEAVLTVGGPLHEWREGLVDGVLSVNPLECMPGKIAEAQLFHAGEREGLVSLTIPVNGDPIDPEVFDNFAFEVHTRFRERRAAEAEEAAVESTASPFKRLLGVG